MQVINQINVLVVRFGQQTPFIVYSEEDRERKDMAIPQYRGYDNTRYLHALIFQHSLYFFSGL